MFEDLTLPVVVVAAAVDSINPCAIGVILFLVSVLLRFSARTGTILKLGLVYVATVYVVYTASGLGLVWFQHELIELGLARWVGTGVGSLVILLGLIEVKDFFWPGRGPSLGIAEKHKERLVQMAERTPRRPAANEPARA